MLSSWPMQINTLNYDSAYLRMITDDESDGMSTEATQPYIRVLSRYRMPWRDTQEYDTKYAVNTGNRNFKRVFPTVNQTG
jgi:hypothetical protein